MAALRQELQGFIVRPEQEQTQVSNSATLSHGRMKNLMFQEFNRRCLAIEFSGYDLGIAVNMSL